MADTIVVVTEVPVTVEVSGPQGPQGTSGQGVATGGTTGQVLKKKSGTDYDTEWGAAASGTVTSVALAGTGLSISGSPVTTSGTITANVSYGTTAGTATQGNDARIAGIFEGSINTYEGSSITTSVGGVAITCDSAGSINTVNGGSISTGLGGSIDTSGGGGSISTRGTGSIELGNTGTRTTIAGTATANRTVSYPNADGTLALTQQVTDYEVTDSTKGVIMKSPNGSRWRLTIDDSGSLIRTIITLIFLMSFMCGSHAQVRDLVYGTNNVVIGPTNTNALAFTNSVAFSNPITFGTNAATTRTNLGVTVASNLPAPYSGSATTNSLLVANGSGSSVFVSTLPSLTLSSGTLTNDAGSLNVFQTWNNSGIGFDAIYVNITNTASGSGSTFARFRFANSSNLLLRRDGAVIARGGYAFNPDNPQTFIVEDAAYSVAQRNGTNQQTYNVYGSYTNSTNYRRLSVGMSNSGIAYIRPEQAGPLTNASNLIYISGLPTNSTGLPSGVLWNSNGSVVVSP